MIRKLILNIIFLFICLYTSRSQEIVTGLQINRQLKDLKSGISESKGLTADTLELPFFDDFSGQGIFPNSKKWSDNYVLINNTYTDQQITIGVATFDALNNIGRLYETASATGFEADHLTSLPINLNYSTSDSIWLSFLVEPGGLADLPEENDSLTLQFFAPEENKWHSVWKTTDISYTGFKAFTIKIDQPRFLKKGFSFRFINYASLSSNLNNPSMVSNCDQWNIDYVLFDRGRTDRDTIYRDVAFRHPLRSLLKTYEAMPWKQFRQTYLQEMGSYIPIHYRNNDTLIDSTNVTRYFEIWDLYKNSQAIYLTPKAANIGPLSNVDYNANLIYTFDTDNNDSALFRIKSWLETQPYDRKENDTLVYYQRFSNYFAFDDGTAEGGYGINGLGSRNAMVAYRYKSFMKDTLRAINICFNDSYENANQRAFDLMVWDDNGGLPGDVLYSRQEVMVVQGDSINGFHTYNINTAVPVNGIFYVGWKQRSDTFLNAGFDINTPQGGKQFYWINGNWTQSQVAGSVMIRPVVGAPITTSVNDIWYKSLNQIHLWPNPAKEFIRIDPGDLPVSGLIYVTIFDLQGRELLKVPFSDSINISSLHEGIYIIITTLNGRTIGYNRLVKTR
jgi:hypothetical protein